jgi:hypothetical protein
MLKAAFEESGGFCDFALVHGLKPLAKAVARTYSRRMGCMITVSVIEGSGTGEIGVQPYRAK